MMKSRPYRLRGKPKLRQQVRELVSAKSDRDFDRSDHGKRSPVSRKSFAESPGSAEHNCRTKLSDGS